MRHRPSDKKTVFIEVDPIYLTDTKKKPIEAIIFFNRVTYNPDANTPVLRRYSGFQTVTGNTKDEIGEAVVHFLTQPKVRLLAEGISANDFHRLPREVRNPSKDILSGKSPIYEAI